jgi:TRAP-type C4-dicarboxylate transport system permease small subunit
MAILETISNRVNKLFLWVGGIALVLMTLIACANMLLRPFGFPLKGAYELVGFLGALVVAFPLGYAQITHAHIAVDILANRFSKNTQKAMDVLNSFFCMVFFILVAWQITVFATTIMERGETSETLRIIYYPFVYAVALCCLLLAFVLLIDFLKLIAPQKGAR